MSTNITMNDGETSEGKSNTTFKLPCGRKSMQDYLKDKGKQTETYTTDGWKIEVDKHHIISSTCVHGENGTAVDVCDVCRFASAGLSSLPDMVFPQNRIVLRTGNSSIIFDAFGALKCAAEYVPDEQIQVASASEWQSSRQHHSTLLQRKLGNKNWTYTPKGYYGDLCGFKIAETEEQIDNDQLRRREPIEFYGETHLFEDELDDHGCVQYGVRIRSMPSGWLCVARYFLRVDHVVVEIDDTRLHWRRSHPDCVLRECTRRVLHSAQWTSDVREALRTPDVLSQMLPIVAEERHLLTVET